MKDWHNLKPELFKKQPHYLPGCDSYESGHTMECAPRIGHLQRIAIDRSGAF